MDRNMRLAKGFIFPGLICWTLTVTLNPLLGLKCEKMNPGTVRWAMTLSRQLRKLCTDMWHDGYCACHLPSHKYPLKCTHTDALRNSAVKTLEITPMIVSVWSWWSKGAKRNESGLLGSCGEWHGFLRLLTFLFTVVFTTFTVIILPVHQVF